MSNFLGGSTSKTSIPSWVENAGKTIYGKALKFYNSGYKPYTGQRVADFNPTQNDAFSQIGDKSNYGDSSIPTIDNVGHVVDSYMNPYIKGVVDPAVAEINRSADTERGRIGDAAFGAHAFGDARQGLRENELQRTTSTAIGDVTGKLYSEGYDKAINTGFEAGAAQNKSFLDRIMAQLGAGNLQQQNSQSKLDTDYQAYQAKQQNPYDKLAALMSVIQGVPYSRTTQTSSNPFSEIAKILGAGAGA